MTSLKKAFMLLIVLIPGRLSAANSVIKEMFKISDNSAFTNHVTPMFKEVIPISEAINNFQTANNLKILKPKAIKPKKLHHPVRMSLNKKPLFVDKSTQTKRNYFSTQ